MKKTQVRVKTTVTTMTTISDESLDGSASTCAAVTHANGKVIYRGGGHEEDDVRLPGGRVIHRGGGHEEDSFHLPDGRVIHRGGGHEEDDVHLPGGKVIRRGGEGR